MADPFLHLVREGEHLFGIAAHYGVSSWETIWNAAENASLREVRRSPNLLAAGDQLWIPMQEPKKEDTDTEQHHHFIADPFVLVLRLRVVNERQEAIVHAEYELRVEGEAAPRRGRTDDEGRITEEIPSTCARAKLVVPVHGRALAWDLEIGALDPLGEPTEADPDANNAGPVRQRLRNLGLASQGGQSLGVALEKFCRIYRIPPTRDASDERLRRKLDEVHDRLESGRPQ